MKKFIVFSIVLFSSLLLFSASVYNSTDQGATEIAKASAETTVAFDLSAGDEGTEYLVFGFTGEEVSSNDFAPKNGKEKVSLKQKVNTTTVQESTKSALVADNTDDTIYAFWQISSGKSITLALMIDSALTYEENNGAKIPWSVTWDSNKSVASPTGDTPNQTNVHVHNGSNPVESGSVALKISTEDLSNLNLSNKIYTAKLTMIVVSYI
ncbi:MAG TPA: hypothetical protein IAB12_00940 [Candidatus Ornithospirochaeta avicola]|uniref:WxL domain-containing protein n=1 Tax=Candidatus Ornithospirochaeta avicola TaxID=2840896 RepID=A0A9D1PSJ9_9SPIO|nr:hypothetical protein [Candidatus Ornithospirochaeta avicola]